MRKIGGLREFYKEYMILRKFHPETSLTPDSIILYRKEKIKSDGKIYRQEFFNGRWSREYLYCGVLRA